jgi:hypothetical protein
MTGWVKSVHLLKNLGINFILQGHFGMTRAAATTFKRTGDGCAFVVAVAVIATAVVQCTPALGHLDMVVSI